MLDICKSTCLRIVNGRVGNTNQHTFVSSNGTSVIHYVLCQERNFSQINDFTIGSFNEWSDHAPLPLTLLCNNIPENEVSYSELKFKWNDNCKELFRSGIIAQLPLFNSIVHSLGYNNRESVNTTICNFTDVLRNVADPLFSKHCYFKKVYSFDSETFMKQTEWFDHECVSVRMLIWNL